MEFKDLKNIWEKQNKEDMYTINESVFGKLIIQKYKEEEKLIGKTELGWFIIMPLTALYVCFLGGFDIYSITIALSTLAIGGYVAVTRIMRKKKLKQYDHTALGKINHAIANINFQIKLQKRAFYLTVIPLIPAIVSLSIKGFPSSVTFYLVLIGVVGFAFITIQYKLRKTLFPRRKSLELIKEKLMEEINES